MIVSCISGGKGWKRGARWGASGLSEERVAVLQQRVALREELRGVRRHLHVALRGAGYDRVHVGAEGRELLREAADAVLRRRARRAASAAALPWRSASTSSPFPGAGATASAS